MPSSKRANLTSLLRKSCKATPRKLHCTRGSPKRATRAFWVAEQLHFRDSENFTDRKKREFGNISVLQLPTREAHRTAEDNITREAHKTRRKANITPKGLAQMHKNVSELASSFLTQKLNPEDVESSGFKTRIELHGVAFYRERSA